jgi:activator of 2-hydroxyglutaryl-CoA dehydratase
MSDYFAGIDIGSTMTKVVIMNQGIISSIVGPTGPEQRRLANKVMENALQQANLPFAECKTIIDIGGQDCKGIKIEMGRPVDFVMNDKCAAGTGRFLEVIADALGIAIEDLSELALKSTQPAQISNICTVFAEQEVVSRLAEGVPLTDLVAGILESLASRISRMVNRLKVENEVVVTGGGAKNPALVEALSQKLGYATFVPDDPLLTGAVGAALLGKDIAQKATNKGHSLETKNRSLGEIEIL